MSNQIVCGEPGWSLRQAIRELANPFLQRSIPNMLGYTDTRSFHSGFSRIFPDRMGQLLHVHCLLSGARTWLQKCEASRV